MDHSLQATTSHDPAASDTSIEFRLDIERTNQLSELLDKQRSDIVDAETGVTPRGPPATVLSRLLSLDPIISTESSTAVLHQSAQDQNDHVGFRRIGFGQCGLVFERPGRRYVVKLARPYFHDGLWNDCIVHSYIYEAFEKQSKDPQCRLPSLYSYAPKDDERWWHTYAPLFEKSRDFPIPTMALITERILPLPRVIRNALIDMFCPDPLKDAAKLNPANRDCLARVYLGRRRGNLPPAPNFSLRNFNLHLDQMILLHLPVDTYARAIAEALAIIHWSAKVDGYDIEFVLGSEAENIYSAPLAKTIGISAKSLADMPPHKSLDNMLRANYHRRVTRMWLLDFNLCNRLSEEAFTDTAQHIALINQLVLAFFENDPYYPLPLMEAEVDKHLWSVFRSEYLQKSAEILDSHDEVVRELPLKFINACVHREQMKLQAGLGHGHRDLKG